MYVHHDNRIEYFLISSFAFYFSFHSISYALDFFLRSNSFELPSLVHRQSFRLSLLLKNEANVSGAVSAWRLMRAYLQILFDSQRAKTDNNEDDDNNNGCNSDD